ncbi:MAG: PQQ-like beta-propeller repeat protein [Phycisphaerae bacterium]|nr:PQQ-like beta-propeller repeat protein [Phycisphaerae bacterium]
MPATLPAESKVLWRVRVGFSLASPVVSGKRVFHLDNQRGKETVLAVDAASGKELWSAALDDAFKDGQSESGPRCTPVADEGRLYVQSCRGEFQCLNVDDGKVIWRTNFVRDFAAVFTGEKGRASGASRHGYCGSPLVDGDRIIAGVGGPNGASVVCFNKLTGKVIWKSQNDIPGYAGPVIATIAGVRQVICFTATSVIGLDAARGTLLWRTAVKTSLGRHVTTPVVVDDAVVVSSHQAGLIGIKVSPAGEPRAFTADRAWVAKGSAAINFSSPVVVGNHLYGLGKTRTLVCVDVRTGQRAWAKDWTASRMFGKGYASFMVMGDRILALAEDGTLFMMAADVKAFRMIAKVKVCGKNWCSPAYAGGRLFLRDARELLCIELMPPANSSDKVTTWKQAMDVALARAKAGDFAYITNNMLAPTFVDVLVARYGKQHWKKKFLEDKLKSLSYYYGWLENPRVETSGDTTVIRGRHGCYATFIKIHGKYALGDFGQNLSSM